MDSYKKLGRGSASFRVRIMTTERPTYSIEYPNPSWKNLGEEWIQFAIIKRKDSIQYDVAYIPHIGIRITQGIKSHDVIPTYWDLQELPDVCNFSMSGNDGYFRLNARYKATHHEFVGSRHNVDLSPIDDRETILDLLKIAERIFPPGTEMKRPVT